MPLGHGSVSTAFGADNAVLTRIAPASCYNEWMPYLQKRYRYREILWEVSVR